MRRRTPSRGLASKSTGTACPLAGGRAAGSAGRSGHRLGTARGSAGTRRRTRATACWARCRRGRSWIVFSAPWLTTGSGALDHGAISSMVAMALGIALVSILVVRWITGPLRATGQRGGPHRPRSEAPAPCPPEARRSPPRRDGLQRHAGPHRASLEDRTEALAAMSHDLRTPLSRLQLRVGFLQEGEDRARMEAISQRWKRWSYAPSTTSARAATPNRAARRSCGNPADARLRRRRPRSRRGL